MTTPSLTAAEIDAQVAARLLALFRGDSGISDETARIVAERIYLCNADRQGNESVAFESLGNWEKVKFDRMARAAVQAFLETDGVAVETSKTQGG